MKQHISTLMDGELFDDEAGALLDSLKRNPGAQEEWLIYHLIGDTLRQPDHVHADISTAMRERLLEEPAVLAPHRRASQNARWFALSAAASVMALAVVAWLSAQVGTEPAPRLAMKKSVDSGVHPASFSAKRSVNTYLVAHQEYSPAANVRRDAASYIHTVAGHK